jgi:hypothetical protein
MGGWGRNIAPKTLHVSGARVAQALKRMLGRLPKLDIFRCMVSFEVLVSRLMFRGVQFSAGPIPILFFSPKSD